MLVRKCDNCGRSMGRRARGLLSDYGIKLKFKRHAPTAHLYFTQHRGRHADFCGRCIKAALKQVLSAPKKPRSKRKKLPNIMEWAK